MSRQAVDLARCEKISLLKSKEDISGKWMEVSDFCGREEVMEH